MIQKVWRVEWAESQFPNCAIEHEKIIKSGLQAMSLAAPDWRSRILSRIRHFIPTRFIRHLRPSRERVRVLHGGR